MDNKTYMRYSTAIAADKQNKTVTVTPIVFNSKSEYLYDEQRKRFFREIIKPESVTKSFLDEQDIIMTFNHQADKMLPLARSKQGKGTMSYTIDNRGVHATFPIKDKDMDILEAIESGDISQASFQFYPTRDGEKIYMDEETGEEIHEITRMKFITDFSIVTRPAYADTSIRTRALEQIENDKKERDKQVQDQKDKDEKERMLKEAQDKKEKEEKDKKEKTIAIKKYIAEQKKKRII